MHLFLRNYALPSLIFAIVAGLFRLLVKTGIESRYQILAFMILALGFEAVAIRFGLVMDWRRGAICAAVAAAAIIAVKWYLEGPPFPIHQIMQLFG